MGVTMGTKKKSDADSKIEELASIVWHNIPEEILYEELQTEQNGLSQDEAEKRLEKYGPNTLPAPQPPTLPQVIFNQFKSPLIYILVVAGVFAFAIGDYKDAYFILAVVFINTLIGTIEEWKAERKAHALQELMKIKAIVRRSGKRRTISAEELVPGDIVFVESGDKVPADVRLISVNNLAVDESFLTGESVAVEKRTGKIDEDTPISDRENMAFAGATVMSGRGTGIVIGTGMNTAVGDIASSVTTAETAKPPLVIRMELFAKQISYIVLGFAFVLGGISIYGGLPFDEVFFMMVAMAVSAIPEGLPAAMTVALSVATSRMAQRNVIVRKLMAVESLGSCTTIASDKTGTLTVNQQTVKQILLPDGVKIGVEGQGYNDEGKTYCINGDELDNSCLDRLSGVALAGIMSNEASLKKEDDGKWAHNGDAMDVALLAFAYKLDMDPEAKRDEYEIIDEIPFESDKRYSAVAYKSEDGTYLAMKGAIESLIPFSSHVHTEEGEQPVDEELLNQQATELAEDGHRVLAIAFKKLDDDSKFEKLTEAELKDMTILGLAGFIDPLRSEVKDAVKEATDAGVRVIMITGDHPITAFAIAEELGIAQSREEVVTGKMMEEMGDHDTPEFRERIKDVTVFARVTPNQKLQIVDALVKLGEFVAVTGDGVNDAPALRRANIGVAMGSGTDIAKDTALITVVDDNFASIVAGIEEGRFAYANVRKVTQLLVSTGAAELILFATVVITGLQMGLQAEHLLPLLAAQILWVNLVTNGIQGVALGFEAGEKGVMDDPPRRPNEGVFNKKMIEQVLLGAAVMGLICFAYWYLTISSAKDDADLIFSLRNQLLTLLVIFQFYHVLNCRSERVSAFKVPWKNNRILLIGMIAAFSLHVFAIYNPFLQNVLRTEPLDLNQWFQLAGIAAAILLVMEIYKMYCRSREKTNRQES